MSTETIARPADAAPKPTEFTDAEHSMLDAMNVPTNRFGRALLFREMHRTGLDPFAKHLYLREDWNNKAERNVYAVASTIAGFEIVANRQPTYEGQTAPQWCDKSGKWFEVWVADAPPVAARIGVYVRGYREPMWGIARFSEYKPNGSAGFMWSKMAAHMIAKVAEALAIRKAYPDQLSGVYTDDEMQQADARREEQGTGDKPRGRQQQRQAPRGNDEWNSVPPHAIAAQQDADAEAPQDARPLAADPGQLASILAALQARGIKDRTAALATIIELAGRQISAPAGLTAAEANRVLGQLTAPAAEAEKEAVTADADEPRQYKMRMMFALIKEKDHTKDGAYALATKVFGHEITSAKQLSSDEVDAFIELLKTGELPPRAATSAPPEPGPNANGEGISEFDVLDQMIRDVGSDEAAAAVEKAIADELLRKSITRSDAELLLERLAEHVAQAKAGATA